MRFFLQAVVNVEKKVLCFVEIFLDKSPSLWYIVSKNKERGRKMFERRREAREFIEEWGLQKIAEVKEKTVWISTPRSGYFVTRYDVVPIEVERELRNKIWKLLEMIERLKKIEAISIFRKLNEKGKRRVKALRKGIENLKRILEREIERTQE